MQQMKNMKTELKSIEEELVDCRAAHRNSKVGDLVFACHHKVLLEVLTEPAENRIAYIMTEKPENERAARLRCFRPWVGPIPAELAKAYAERAKASAELAKASAELTKAYDEWTKARAAWDKADAERDKADAEWSKARTAWDKARTAWDKADAERDKADAEWSKARTAWVKARTAWAKASAAVATPAVYAAQWPDHCWVNGRVLGT